jgi:hypothetical protein
MVFDGDKDNDITAQTYVKIASLDTPVYLPQVGATITSPQGDNTNDENAAPKLTFVNDSDVVIARASGVIASELIDNSEYKVYLSYTIFTGGINL